MHEPWIAWLYQYVIGGALFVLTLFMLFRVGAVHWDNLKSRWLVVTMTAGLLVFAALHAIWIFLAGN